MVNRRLLLLLCLSSVVALASDDLTEPIPKPVVFVYSDKGCPGCVKFWKWHELHGANSRWRFVKRKSIDDWVKQIPAFHFQSQPDRWHVVYGWRDVEAFAAEYDRAGGK